MTVYKCIFGKPIKTLTTDPTDTGAEGQIWYNSTAAAFKSVLVGDAWVSGAPLTTSRFQGGMIGTQTSALLIGSENPTTANLGTVEEYNGAGWSSSPSVSTARQGIGSTGTTSAGLAMGGMISGPNVRQTLSEEWNGTAWTAGNTLTEAGRANISGAATQTAGVAMFSGELTPDSNSGKYHEQYDGTSWTASTKCPTVRVQGSYAGDQTAGIGFGGRANSPGAPSVRNKTSDIWNGTTWTSGPSGVTERSGHSSHGTDSSAIFCRGATNPGSTILTSTEEYDGTSFSATPSVTNTGQGFEGGHAQPSSVGAAWIAGGSPVQNQTEEFNRSTSVITPGAWASGPSVNTARQSGGTANLSPQTANIIFTGYTAPPTATGNVGNTEEYDGSAWTTVNPVNTGRRAVSGAGTQTSALLAGGYSEPAGNVQNKTEEYDGTTWTVAPTLNTARYTHGGAGSQAAAWVAGNTPVSQSTETYNGTSWTSANNLLHGREATVGDGTNTAGIIFGSGTTPDADQKRTEHWDGTSWTSGGTLNIGIRNSHANGGSSAQTAALKIGGIQTPGTNVIASVEEYDGSVWRTQASLANATQVADGGGTTSAGMCAAGADTASVSRTEEFTAETSALNLKTLTTS